MANLSSTITANPSVVITTPPGVSSNYVIDEDESLSLKQYRKKHMTALMATFPANLIMLCGGVQLSWGIYTSFFQPISEGSSHLKCSWFIGAIIGALIATVLIKMLKKCYFMYAGGVLILLNGILYVALPQNYAAFVASRYLGGIGYGLVFLIGVIYTSEIAPKRLRGTSLSTISYSTMAGIFMGSMIFRNDNIGNNLSLLTTNQIYGIIFIVLSLFALVGIPFLVRESPVFLLQQGKDTEAFSMLLTLQNQTVETPRIRQQYMELKNMVNEAENESGIIISHRNLMPFIQGILLRFILALAMSLPINIVTSTPYFLFFLSLPAANLVVVFRLFGEIGSLGLVDRIGRRKLLLISVFASGLLLIVIGIILVAVKITNWIIPVLSIITGFYQFVLGIGLSNVSTTYLGEAFPLSKKPLSIFSIFTVEYLMHIILIVIVMNLGLNFNTAAFLFITAIVLLFSGGYFYKFYPETKDLTLKQSIDVVRN